ncbi:MAG TPA: hypothetical protein DDZ89_16150, partial [Clostridiales bacterium]|nr:hypothetical protein [Clostridiales bacterium]
MKYRKLIFHIILISGIIFSLFARRFSYFIETVYSTRIYPWLISPYSRFTGLFQFSIAEIIVVLLIACIVFLLIRGLVLFIKNPKEFMKK